MNTKTLSNRALSVIEQYLHFKVGGAACSIPYFNNKTTRSRAALRAFIGKGSPKELFDEVRTLLIKSHVNQNTLIDETLKKILTDNNLGIDCSAFAYYILNAERLENGKSSLDKHMHFVNCYGITGKLRALLRPIENCDVATMADDKNSSVVSLTEIIPSDIITMTHNTAESERDHILVIHQIEYQNFIPTKIHYSHAVAYPEDGVYGTGIKQGVIEVLDSSKPIQDQRWIENLKEGNENRIFIRAQKSKTELRRIRD